jgi:hypothetical protein
VTELRLNQNINATITAIPHVPGLRREDLEDAMEYAGLKLLRSYNFYGGVDEVSAAYAGLDNGLCHNPEDTKSCEDEEANMRSSQVLSISFTNYMLSLRMSSCRAARICWDYNSEENSGLGLRFEHRYGAELEYWAHVRRSIRRFAEVAWKIDKLHVFGEAASNEHFQEALRGALRDLEPRAALAMGASEKMDPLSLAARGAAEFAKRFQVMTWGCQEPSSCNETEAAEKPVADL